MWRRRPCARPSVCDLLLVIKSLMGLYEIRYRLFYKMVSSMLKFRENQLSESHAFFRDINQFLSVLSTFLDRFESN